MEWQPIETAPRDGTHIWVYMEECQIEAWWDGEEWYCVRLALHGCGYCSWRDHASSRDDAPTHWMPLPDPPQSEVEA